MKTVTFCGGGTAGHVVPNLNIIRSLWGRYKMYYIGSGAEVETKVLANIHMDYYIISCGKFRRYWDWRFFTDGFKIIRGIIQSYKILSYISPDVVFSKGGYVSVPVVIAAWIKGIPVISHESDLTMGLANKIIAKFAKVICLAFEAAVKDLPPSFIPYTGEAIEKKKQYYLVTGLPIEIYQPNISKEDFLKDYGLDPIKKTIFIFGGSQGAKFINDFVIYDEILLSGKYNIIHQCGLNHFDQVKPKVKKIPNYVLVGFASQQEMSWFYNFADLVVSRAGATSLFEILSYRKKSILIPLPLLGSRGDQIQNAQILKERRLAEVILQEEFTEEVFFSKLKEVLSDTVMQANLNAFEVSNETGEYEELIEKIAS